jgi:peptidyl-tRNA hydrolase, PTH1 family
LTDIRKHSIVLKLKANSKFLVVGLGNPGKKYIQTRHNVGYQAVERFAGKHQARFKAHSYVPGMVAEVPLESTNVILLKPVTFMNLSGQAVVGALNFWNLEPRQILVIIDEVELPLGRLRLRANGSAGGHNGLKSIIEQLGTKEFARLRIGIGRPADRTIDLADWVLQPFQKSELICLDEWLNKTVCAVEDWVQEGPTAAMNRYNTADVLLKGDSRDSTKE